MGTVESHFVNIDRRQVYINLYTFCDRLYADAMRNVVL